MLTLRFVKIIPFCLIVLAPSGCATTTACGAVSANRSQMMLVSSDQLDQMVAQSYAKLQSDSSGKGWHALVPLQSAEACGLNLS